MTKAVFSVCMCGVFVAKRSCVSGWFARQQIRQQLQNGSSDKKSKLHFEPTLHLGGFASGTAFSSGSRLKLLSVLLVIARLII